jgi:YQGE family putative transporter
MKKNFLLASWLFGLGNSFSSPLVGLYIYVNSSIFYTLDFLLINSSFILLGYLIVGYLSTIWKRSIVYYRLGIFLYVIFYIVLFLTNTNAFKVVNIIGALYGLAQGFYWSGWDILFYNTPKKLNFFNKSAYLGLITSIVSPGVYGSILSIFHNNGYEILFVLTSLFLLFSVLLAENVEVRSFKFDIKKAVSVFNENKIYKNSMTSLAIISGVNYILGNLNTILIYSIAKTYFNFMIINYILTGFSVFSVYVLRDKLVNKIKPYKLVLFGSLIIGISSLLIFLGFPLFYLVSFNVASPLIYPVIDVFNWNNMDRRFLTSYLVNRQIFLNLGRILSSVSEIFLANLAINEEIIPLLPVVVVASILFARSNSKEKVIEA